MTAELNHPMGRHDTNNFNLLRFLAAITVLVAHAYPLSLGAAAPDPVQRVLNVDLGSLPLTLGTLAVCAFFAISGYFILQSFDKRLSLLEFAVARLLRLLPALLIVLVVTAFALGPLLTTLPPNRYFLDLKTLEYVPTNMTLRWGQDFLPGVFADNPFGVAANGSLWTLFFEATWYVILTIVGTTCRTPRSFIAFLVLFTLAYFAITCSHTLSSLHHAAELGVPFVIGMCAYRYHWRFRFSVVAGLSIAAALLNKSVFFPYLIVATVSYGALCLGFRTKPLKIYRADYSYGTYIYAFPVAQSVIALRLATTPVEVMLWSLPITLTFAWLSWHLVEKRALSLKHRIRDGIAGRQNYSAPAVTLAEPSSPRLMIQ